MDAHVLEVGINGRFVREHHRFLCPVGDSHDVDVMELGPSLAPIGMRHDMVAPYLASRLDLTTLGQGPMKERVKPCDSLPILERLNVFEKSRKTSNDLSPIKILRNPEKGFKRDCRFLRAGFPDVR